MCPILSMRWLHAVIVEVEGVRSGCVVLQVAAIAYDNPIPGFHTNNTINLRLWAAKPGQEFDLEAFNTGDYVQVFPRLLFTLLVI